MANAFRKGFRVFAHHFGLGLLNVRRLPFILSSHLRPLVTPAPSDAMLFSVICRIPIDQTRAMPRQVASKFDWKHLEICISLVIAIEQRDRKIQELSVECFSLARQATNAQIFNHINGPAVNVGNDQSKSENSLNIK